MIISTFRKTDQKRFPNAYFYATKKNLGTNIFAKIIFLATTPIRRRLGKAKEKLVFLGHLKNSACTIWLRPI